MARPKNDPGDCYGLTDMAKASMLPVRSLEYLKEHGCVPYSTSLEILERVVVIGALNRAGIGLSTAAQLATTALAGRAATGTLIFRCDDGEWTIEVNLDLAMERALARVATWRVERLSKKQQVA